MRAYPDFGHPGGIDARPWFSIRENKLYPDFGHPDGIGARPWFSIRGNELYPDFGHPDGIGARPWFSIRGERLRHSQSRRELQGRPAGEVGDGAHLQVRGATESGLAHSAAHVRDARSDVRVQSVEPHDLDGETMRYVHVANAHRRQIPEEVLRAAGTEIDPDRRVVLMLGARRGTPVAPTAAPNKEAEETSQLN
jgi:hypothetical protein